MQNFNGITLSNLLCSGTYTWYILYFKRISSIKEYYFIYCVSNKQYTREFLYVNLANYSGKQKA